MNDLVPLVLLLMVSRARGGTRSSTPLWPNAASPPPPPPLPAPPDASPAEALADMVQARDKLYETVQKAGPKKTIKSVMRPAAKKLKPIVVTAKPKPDWLNYSPEMDVSVYDIQKALIKRGAKLAKDGLYGPKTQAAWISVTKKWKLPQSIEQVTSKIARVASKSYTTLTDPNRVHVP